MDKGVELWAEAKGLLLPYIGMASQIYVLDLPLGKLGVALDKLGDQLSHPHVITLASESVDPMPLTEQLRKTLMSSSSEPTHHIIKGDWAPGDELCVWLWIESARATFDVEFVFWADLLFPDPDDEAACIEAFCHSVALAEAFRGINPRSECVLSENETGDPRDERNSPSALFW